MSVHPHDARQSFSTDPYRRLLAEVYCFALAFVFHPDNDDTRKAVTILVVGAWCVLEIGAAYGFAKLPSEIWYLRIFVGIIVGRMWGIEFNNFAGVEYTQDDSHDSDSSNNNE